MNDGNGRVCKRCLLKDLADSADILAEVERIKRLMSDAERAGDELYERRLSVCRECDRLIAATCQKCGCYVEIRALAKGASCPGKKW